MHLLTSQQWLLNKKSADFQLICNAYSELKDIQTDIHITIDSASLYWIICHNVYICVKKDQSLYKP